MAELKALLRTLFLTKNKAVAKARDLKGMAIRVVEFSNEGYKIRKIFA